MDVEVTVRGLDGGWLPWAAERADPGGESDDPVSLGELVVRGPGANEAAARPSEQVLAELQHLPMNVDDPLAEHPVESQ